MKKVLSLILVIALCVSVCGCGKSQSVKDVEAAIKAIGEVTLESGDAIEKAERLYDFLTESEKVDVGNKADLVEARIAYDNLYEDKVYSVAKEAYELINKAYSLYLYEGHGLIFSWNFALSANARIMDDDFCKRLAEASPNTMGLPKLTEQEVADGLQFCLDKNYFKGNEKADYLVCMTLFRNTYAIIRKYTPWVDMENAGVLLLELKDTYHDEKYYPILKEYFDFVTTGETFITNVSNIRELVPNYQSQQVLYEQQINPMFVE